MTVHRLSKYQTEDPFTRIPNAAINDDALDLKALGLLLVMLSKPDGWRFNERNLAADVGVSRAQVRTAIATLMDAGYVHRDRVVQDGRPIMVTKVFDQANPQGGEPGPSRGSDSPKVANPDGPEPVPLSNDGVLVTKEDPSTTEEPSEPVTDVAAAGWDEARALCEYLADTIVETGGPDTRRPTVTKAWVTEMERLVRIDGRDPDRVRAAIEWAHRGPGSVASGTWAGWGAQVLSPGALRRHYEKMSRQARAKGNGSSNGRTTGDQFRAAAAHLREQGR